MTQTITRHYLTINGRQVHYRKCGEGPPVLMIHQSPRSSAEYEPLMCEWGAHFTCIAPDTPGFGQSTPLAMTRPEIDDYADAIIEFAEALGCGPIPAYGFHSGAIILITAVKRRPDIFRAIAAGGYAVWTAEETRVFGEKYLPPFLPQSYGEHLTWAWNRVLEQSWFFPWYQAEPATRLSMANDDPAKVHEIILEILDAGDYFRLGYGAVLRAPRDIPPVDAVTPPVLITAYKADPLHAHLARLGEMPANWQADGVETPEDQVAANLAFLRQHVGQPVVQLAEDGHHGFIHIKAGGFDGLIHWRGNRHNADSLVLHAPGREMQDHVPENWVCIDMPGHGLSDNWPDRIPSDVEAWNAVTNAARHALNAGQSLYRLLPEGDPDKLFPDLSPDRHGNYLTKGWSIIRAGQFFCPWYEANAAHASAFETGQIAPEALAQEHRALLRARAAREMMIAYSNGDFAGGYA